MTFENEFFEMAQALEENSEMLNVQNKLTDAQVNNRFYFYFIQKRALSHLSTNIPSFKNLARQITSNSDGFDKWLNTTEIATQVPVVWENNGDKMNEISSAVYS
jgi:hypothetical protein